MNLNDYQCPKCKRIEADQEEPPTCCGQEMQKVYKPTPVVWNTTGGTREKTSN